MVLKNVLKKLPGALIFMCAVSYALPFNIFPKAGTTLPTTIYPGQNLTVLYTVVNNTARTLSNNYVRYLPPNVSQVTVDPTYSDLCAATFTLGARGRANDSCTLELTVAGVVNGASTISQNHLFVCIGGTKTSCAGSPFVLNVTEPSNAVLQNLSISPNTPQIIPVNGTFQYSAIGTYSNGGFADLTSVSTWSSTNLAVATITNGLHRGIATGIAPGTTTIQASFAGLTPFITLSVRQQKAYVTNAGNNSLSVCDLAFTTCSVDSDGTFDSPKGVAVNSAYTYAYIPNRLGNTVSICPVNLDGTLGTCTAATDSSFASPQGVTVNSSASVLYVTNEGARTVSICPLASGGGSLSGTCTADSGNNTFNAPSSIVLNPSGTYAYVANYDSNSVTVCQVNTSTGLFMDSTCAESTAYQNATPHAPIGPVGTVLNAAGTYLYTSNLGLPSTSGSSTIIICSVSSLNGQLSSCNSFTNPLFNAIATNEGIEGVGIDAAGANLYITYFGNEMFICQITGSGASLGTCTTNTGGGTFNVPFSAYVH